MKSQVASALPTMKYEEFLAWASDEMRAEWVDGRVEFMEPVSDEHNDETGILQSTIRTYVEEKGLGKVRSEPFQMKLDRPRAGRSPDLIFISTEKLPNIRNSFIDGPADLVIEIVSPEGQERDRVTKFKEYEQGGVREYWLIDPVAKSAEFYHLNAESRFEPMPIKEGVFHSEVIAGLWIKIEWLWRETRPTVLQVLREWNLV